MPTLSILGSLIIISYFGMKEVRSVNSLNDFAFSKGSFTTLTLITTIVASYLGGGMVIGTAEKGFELGLAPVLALLGFSLQIFLTGQFITKRLYRQGNFVSPGEILSKRYGPLAQFFVGGCWTLFCIGLLSGQMLALGRVLSLFVPISPQLNNLMASSFLILYCLLGGIRAVVLTDRLQFWIIVTIVPALLVSLVHLFIKSGHTIENIPPASLSLFSHMTPIGLISVFIGFMLGDFAIPPIIQRVQLAKNYFQAKKALIVSSVIVLCFTLICGAIGLFVSTFRPDILPHKLVPTLFNELLPLPIQALGAIALLAVIMSSADSYLNSLAFVFVRDFCQPLRKKTFSDKHALLGVRWATLIFGFASYTLSIFGKNSYDLMITACKFWGPMMAIPFLFTLYDKVISKRGFFMTVALSFTSVLLWDSLRLEKVTSISSLVIGIGVSFILYNFFLFLGSFRAQPHVAGQITT